MRRVRLHRNAFIGDCLCEAGSTVDLPDTAALAPFMTEVPPDPAPHHAVSVHYDEKAGEVDITVDGVATHLDHAALRLRMD